MKAFDNVLSRLIEAEKRIGLLTNECDDAKRALKDAILSCDVMSEKLASATASLGRMKASHERLNKIDPAANALYDAAEEFMGSTRDRVGAKKKLADALKAIDPLLDRIPF